MISERSSEIFSDYSHQYVTTLEKLRKECMKKRDTDMKELEEVKTQQKEHEFHLKDLLKPKKIPQTKEYQNIIQDSDELKDINTPKKSKSLAEKRNPSSSSIPEFKTPTTPIPPISTPSTTHSSSIGRASTRATNTGLSKAGTPIRRIPTPTDPISAERGKTALSRLPKSNLILKNAKKS